jgi:tetratricopeptide (TPR) repeat protein
MVWGGHEEFRTQESEMLLRRALAIEEKLAIDYPTVPDYKQLVAACRKFLACLLRASDRSDEAEKTFRESLQLDEHLVADFPLVLDYGWELFDMRRRLLQMLFESGRFEEAERTSRESLALLEKLPGNFRSLPNFRHVLAHNYHCLGEVLCAAGRIPDAEKAYRRALAIWDELVAAFPSVAEHRNWLACCHNNLAELFTTSSDTRYRDPARAVQLATRAVQLHVQPGGCWNTLGICHYRNGAWNAAIRALEKSMELRDGGDCYDWFFLAMANWRLDHKEEARKWYERANAWMENKKAELARNKPKDAQLRRFRTEAANLLGVDRVSPSLLQ